MSDVVPSEKRVFEDPEALAHNVAEWLCALALATNRDFAICCSGGSTPKRLYEVLAEPAIASRFPWSRVHWFWGDERFVPHDHPDSNYGMVRDALLSRVPVPRGTIHPIPTTPLLPEQAAVAYEATLKNFYGRDIITPDRPLFDVTLLGIGKDGHTASLFPGYSALEDATHWALPVVGAGAEARITLTYPLLDSSRDAVFLVTGEAKRTIVERAQAGDWALPAARVRPIGRLHWFMDGAAAVPEQ